MKKSNFFMTFRSWTLVMVPLFSVRDPLSVKLTIFKICPYLKLSIFSQQLISPKLLYFGNPEDLGNDVGDFFAHKVMQIPNIETVFESELTWNFLYHAPLTYFLTSIFLVTLRIQNFLTIQFWSLSDLVSEYRVRFARSIKKYFHFCSKSIKKWHLPLQFWNFFFQKNFLIEIV